VGSNPIGSTNFIPVYYLYIFQSETAGRFYIGQTQDVPERLAYHNANYSNPFRYSCSSPLSGVNSFAVSANIARAGRKPSGLYFHDVGLM